ncbi:TetR/AcrR family transcriptional regulator [Mycobacterium leprae]|nr:TetR/AcrR family transcriptional regulator [Mycobacterium leprae]
MTDAMTGSGAIIGSIYHHFGGKRKLFLAIFEQMGRQRRPPHRRGDATSGPIRPSGDRSAAGIRSPRTGPTSRRCGKTGTRPGCCRPETHLQASRSPVATA